MQSDWPLLPLVDLVERDSPITYGVVKPGPEDPGGVKFIRGGDIADGRVLEEQLRTITEEISVQYKRTLLRGGELVVSLVGNPGQVAIVPPSLRGANIARQVGLVRLANRVDARFVKYYLSSPAGQEALGAHSLGSVQQVINLRDLKTVKIPLPPLARQRSIAGVLAAIDDRIDLLRQTNTTLESIAQALFKSWFIDFDPVRAKAEGREPEGMDAATAALFPAEFEESPLGLIPKGWQTAPLADAMHLNPTRSLSKGSAAPYLEMANAPTTGHRPTEPVGQRAFGSGCKFRNGDALLAKITPCLENGKSAFVDFLDGDEVGWGSTEFIVMRAKPVLPDYCAYLLARHEPFRQFAIQSMTGTSGRQRVELSRLAQFPLALPPDSSVASAVATTFRAFQSRIAADDEVAKSLSGLRDTLLPRLISGRLHLPESQEEIEETFI